MGFEQPSPEVLLSGLPKPIYYSSYVKESIKKGGALIGGRVLSYGRITANKYNACLIDKGNFCVGKTLESWHTAITNLADINGKQLPRHIQFYFEPYISIFTRTQAFLLFLL